MKKLLLILLICSCEPRSEASRKTEKFKAAQNELGSLNRSLTYYKDTNTNLCFAGHGIGWNYAYFTNVPCSPEVEKIAYQFSTK